MEGEPVLMEIHLSEARLTNGITNDGDIIPICWITNNLSCREQHHHYQWRNAAEHTHEIGHLWFSLDCTQLLPHASEKGSGTWPSPNQTHWYRGKVRHIEHGRNCPVEDT